MTTPILSAATVASSDFTGRLAVAIVIGITVVFLLMLGTALWHGIPRIVRRYRDNTPVTLRSLELYPPDAHVKRWSEHPRKVQLVVGGFRCRDEDDEKDGAA